MKPVFLNSIYEKIAKYENFDSLSELNEAYTKKILLLFLELCEEAGISDVRDEIKLTREIVDEPVELFSDAGSHIIGTILHGNDYQNYIKDADEMFLKNCNCQEPDKMLNELKKLIAHIATQSMNGDDWLKFISEHKDF